MQAVKVFWLAALKHQSNRLWLLSFIGKIHNFLTSLFIYSASCVAVVYCRFSWVACRCLESPVSPLFRAVSLVAFTPWKASTVSTVFLEPQRRVAMPGFFVQCWVWNMTSCTCIIYIGDLNWVIMFGSTFCNLFKLQGFFLAFWGINDIIVFLWLMQSVRPFENPNKTGKRQNSTAKPSALRNFPF